MQTAQPQWRAASGFLAAIRRARGNRPGGRRWLPLAAAWLAVTVVLLAAWQAAHHPASVLAMPRWFLGLARLAGSTIYDDPGLTLRIQITRLMLLATVAAGASIAILERRRLAHAIHALVNQESDPINLAVFRIVVFVQIYMVCDLDLLVHYAALPTGLQDPPQTGLPHIGPLAAWSYWPLHTLSPTAIAFAGAILKGAAVLAAVGLFSRPSAALVTVLFLTVWARLEWYGKVDHQHHLLWFALLLALSPCGDVLSLDAWINRRRKSRRGSTDPPPAPSRRYGTPLAFSMLLIGAIYLFPGVWKLGRSGLDWALSDNPKLLMQQEWVVHGYWLPVLRFDEHPLLYRAGTLAAVLFEISCLALLLGRRTRRIAAPVGFGFHLVNYLTLNIPFTTLRNCYVVFVDWPSVLRRLGVTRGGLLRDRRPEPFPTVSAVVGTLLIAGCLWAGATRAMEGWPFACYPLFDGLSQPYTRAMQIEVTLQDGSRRLIDPEKYRVTYQYRWGHFLRRLVQNDDPVQRGRRLQLLWQVIRRAEPWTAEARYLRFYSVRLPVDPARWKEAPDDPQLLYETALADRGP